MFWVVGLLLWIVVSCMRISSRRMFITVLLVGCWVGFVAGLCLVWLLMSLCGVLGAGLAGGRLVPVSRGFSGMSVSRLCR